MDQIFVFLGKLHLLWLHLPIGILIPASVLALWSQWRKESGWVPTIKLAVTAGAAIAVLTAVSGSLLAEHGSYPAEDLFWHRWLGISTAVAALISFFLRNTPWLNLSLYSTTILISVAGHFGGKITHGPSFLVPSENTVLIATTQDGTAYESIINPILQNKCISCHQPSKRKGDLLLDTYENILQGGAHGPVLIPGNADSSTLYQRLLLPAHDEHHMPPRGKTQLSPQEIAWIRQWIELGGNTEVPASALITKVARNQFPDTQVESASPNELVLLKSNRIAVLPLGENVPWLSVSLTGRKDLDPTVFQLLQPLAKQITHLDLAHTNCTDELLPGLNQLKNLTKINLANTEVTSKGLSQLESLPFLHHVNLHQTQVDDQFLEQIARFKTLEEIFVWGTKISAGKIETCQKQFPQLRIVSGPTPDPNAQPLTLVTPTIWYTKSIFDDTLQIKLEFPFKGITLYYTLDQSEPNTASTQYTGQPIILDQSATLRVIAAKTGWENSPVAEATFAKRKYKPLSATLMGPPSDKYPGKGGQSLIDNVLGTDATDPAFLGFEGKNATAIFDFGKNITLTRAGIHYLENNGSWIFAPSGLELWTSADQQNWKSIAKTTYTVNSSMQNSKTGVRSLALTEPVETQYLKITFSSPLTNPQWHPGKGQKCWIFIDEVLIE